MGPAKGGSDAFHAVVLQKLALFCDMMFQATLTKFYVVEGLRE